MTVTKPQIVIPLPSRRTLRKFGRDLLVTVVGAGATYTASNYADLGLTGAQYAALAPVFLLVWRMVRQAMGLEPVA